MLSLPARAGESISGEKITSIITKSKILGENTRVVSTVSGTEAVISTYRHKESVDIDKDCKIDASFIAKELMISNDFGLRRVSVHFHEPDLTGNYREVSVSFAEIKAFSSGAVEQKDFLASLSLNLVPEPGAKAKIETSAGSTNPNENKTGVNAPLVSPEGNAAGTASTSISSSITASKNLTGAGTSGPTNSILSATPTSNVGKNTGISAVKSKLALPRQRFSSARAGFTFLLPYGWTLETNTPVPQPRFPRRGRPITSETIFILKNPSTGYRQIECYRKTDSSSPDASAAKVKQEFSYEGTHVDKYQSVSFGKGPYGGALVSVRYPHEAGEYHETHLFFGTAGMYYDLRGWGPTTDKTFEPAFNDLIATIEFPPAKAAAGKSAKK